MAIKVDDIIIGINTVGQLIDLAERIKGLFPAETPVTQEMIDAAIQAIPAPLELIDESDDQH